MSSSEDKSSDNALKPDFLESLREGFEMDSQERAVHNAVTSTPISQLALNRQVVAGDDGHFSHRIKTAKMTNQKASGRCWLFAGLNTMRPEVLQKHNLEEFDFSTAYLQFWDKLEKSNLYLEEVIELRESDRLDRLWLLINQETAGDGGWWNYVTALVEKYGVVPLSAMPETKSSENTTELNLVLQRLLRVHAHRILESSEQGGDIAALRTLKEGGLAEVYRLLVLNLGEPPEEFEWRYQAKSKKDKKSDQEKQSPEDKQLTDSQTYTPKSFYEEFVGIDLSEFVCLYNDPSQEIGTHLQFERARNVAGEEDMHFPNIEIEDMKKIAVKSVLANQPMWFAVNMGYDQSTKQGLMDVDLFDYESLFGLDLSLSKGERGRFGASASNHAMVLGGVDLRKDGTPRKWLVENSWGDEKGNKGYWTLTDDWFTEHVYTVIVHRSHVPEEILKILGQDPVVLPAWYPGAQGL